MTANKYIHSDISQPSDEVYEDKDYKRLLTLLKLSDDQLTKEDVEFLTKKLSSKLWRLNHLYTIKDKDGVKKKMKLNYSQYRVLTQYTHNKKVILKSRQQGISTLYVAYYLDSCIFTEGYEAGIQSYGRDESEKLSQRAELMWNELDPLIKALAGIALNKYDGVEALLSEELYLSKNNSSGLYFSNGSILKIGNFRGDTLQGLHVSELGKIAKRSPEKAKELKTGAFQAVSVNNKITIESTAEGKSGLLWEIWQRAEKKAILKQELSPLDFQPIFLPWYDDADCQIYQQQDIPDHLVGYFTKLEDMISTQDIWYLGGRRPNYKIPDTYKWWYTVKSEELGEYMRQEYPSTPQEAFEQSIEGMYYKNEFPNLKIKHNLYRPDLLVHMAFDLGMSDDFSIGFFQVAEEYKQVTNKDGVKTEVLVRKPRIVGEYRNSGHGLEHYAQIVKALNTSKGWQFGITYVPHDIEVRELIAGITRHQALINLGFSPVLVPKHRLQDGIECVRQFLKEVEIDDTCDIVLGAIQNYRKKYDKQLQVFLDAPLHDEWSHPADMIRYMAMGYTSTPPSQIYVIKQEPDFDYTYNSYKGYDV